MAISVTRPVPAQFPITGEYLQKDDAWSPDHPHLGVDFGCPAGTRVVSATQQGKVYAIHRTGDGWGDGSFGTCVVVDVVGTPWYYLYAHLSSVSVVVGQGVSPGDLIGLSGSTGAAQGAHLHVQASTDKDFPRANYEEITGDPIRGLRTPQQPPVVVPPPPSMDLAALTALVTAQGQSIATISERIIANEGKQVLRDQKILSAIAELMEALKK